MSTDVIWGVTRNNSAFLLKAKGCSKPLSTDPMSLTSKHAKRHNGSINNKAIAIRAGKNNKGLLVSLKRSGKGFRPSQSVAELKIKSGGRAALGKIRNIVQKQRYRKDLTKAAFRRASVILRSQKPLPKRKGAAAAAKKADK